MSGLSEAARARLAEIAARHGVTPETAGHVLEALRGGAGERARFDVPELGGVGQWARDGSVITGDMLDTDLKARVDALCRELAPLVTLPGLAEPEAPRSDPKIGGGVGSGWPTWPGVASASGAQNDLRYAVFPGRRRLAVARGEAMTAHCVGEPATGGVSRSDGTPRSVTGRSGSVSAGDCPDDRPVVEPRGASTGAGAPTAEEAGRRGAPAAPTRLADPVVLIERLADLHARGILTDGEFAKKKAELLARL
ncbi:hypothetical protein HNP73_002151 [Amaricoccus macauensis]|uniref:SHOCT domain-containing protein n=1 Tax=Amaricoccus macauensis TaxID=57001 RepID=A0A840SNP5_9RHOB|nr:SHOCT domain-containing protein [Amaricoccus macauensis]MBB5222215.1 hypothetical protein [Amaricoccus macauensis]